MSSELQYWCHSCERIFVQPVDVDSDISCPQCRQSFVEVIEDEEVLRDLQNQHSAPALNSDGSLESDESSQGHVWQWQMNGSSIGVPNFQIRLFSGDASGMRSGSLFESLASNISQDGTDVRQNTAVSPSENSGFSFPGFLGQLFGNIASGRGLFQLGEIQHIHGSLGDYGLGMSFEDILEHLRNANPERFGRPAASEDQISALDTKEITADALQDSKTSDCAVCQDRFEVGSSVKLLPCGHCFHEPCIIPWLKQSNSCPVCRAALPDK